MKLNLDSWYADAWKERGMSYVVILEQINHNYQSFLSFQLSVKAYSEILTSFMLTWTQKFKLQLNIVPAL